MRRTRLIIGLDKNAASTHQISPMHYAAVNGCLELVRFLVELGADKNQPASLGETPLHFAAREGHLDIVRFRSWGQPSADNTTSYWAAQYGHIDIFKFLVDVAAEDEPTRDYREILRLAIEEGHVRF